MTLRGGDDCTSSAAIVLGNAHDVDAAHVLCGPQHAHDNEGRPAAAVDGLCRRAAVQARLPADDRLFPKPVAGESSKTASRRSCVSGRRTPASSSRSSLRPRTRSTMTATPTNCSSSSRTRCSTRATTCSSTRRTTTTCYRSTWPRT